MPAGYVSIFLSRLRFLTRGVCLSLCPSIDHSAAEAHGGVPSCGRQGGSGQGLSEAVALGKGAAVAGCVFRRGRPLIFETKLTSLPPSPYLLIPFSASDDTGHYILSYVFLRPAFLPLDPEVEENEEQKVGELKHGDISEKETEISSDTKIS